MSEEDKIQKKTNGLNLFTTKMMRQVEQKNKAVTAEFQKVGRKWERSVYYQSENK